MPSDTREYSWCPFQSREHPTFPADVSNQLHTSLLFPHISKRSQITKWFSGVKVSLWRLSKTFYLTTHCDSQSSFISPPPCPNTHTHTHTHSLFPLFSTLESSFRETFVLFLMTLILSDQTKIVINFHQEGPPLLNEIMYKSSVSLTLILLSL